MVKGKLIGFLLLIVLIIAIAIVVFYSKPVKSNNYATKAQMEFVTQEANAIESSSPIPIKKVVVFGTGANVSQKICGQEQALFTYNSTLLDVKYQGFYVPTIAELEAEYFSNSNYTNLIGQKVILDFMLNNNKNVSAPYTISKIYEKGNEVYWIFNQNTGVSNNNAVSITENITIGMLSPEMVNGVIFPNGTAFIAPMNPYIDNGNFIAPNC